MIQKITLKNVHKCYKNETSLETTQRVTLLYGLNGAGKSTLSNFLQNPEDDMYKECSLTPPLSVDDDVLVYNAKYIEDVFYSSPGLPGIFTLSKGNKDAKESIDRANVKLRNNNIEIEKKRNDLAARKAEFDSKVAHAKGVVWRVKQEYSGGDRVLEPCLSGHKSSKDELFSFVCGLKKPDGAPKKNIEIIKKEMSLLAGAVQKLDPLPILTPGFDKLETSELLGKEIVGSSNSTFSDLIKKLGNSDWVQNGLIYLDADVMQCPFCQQSFDDEKRKDHIIEELKNCFDQSYAKDVASLKNVYGQYLAEIGKIVPLTAFDSNELLSGLKDKYDSAIQKLMRVVNENEEKLRRKCEHPSTCYVLESSKPYVSSVNEIISEANQLIAEHNDKIDRRDETIEQYKKLFWDNVRFEYDQTIDQYKNEEKLFHDEEKRIMDEIAVLENANTELKGEIVRCRKNVTNIDDAVENINNNLVEIGIDGFCIKKHEDDTYRISRGEDEEKGIVFKSLSEGEKTVISFLYFVEECKGMKSEQEQMKKKIVVIDDPVSSLSHIYIFNIGTLIKKEFLQSEKFEQVFVLTHSLYFFYELAKQPRRDMEKLKPEEQEKEQKKAYQLYRLVKYRTGSCFEPMKYGEVQNDYQMYWNIVKRGDNPVVIANCMRNIIDAFFAFVEKKDYGSVFQKNELSGNKYQSFCRFMNRESHSDGQNIFDLKEYDYEAYKEALGLVFRLSGYEEHYKAMMRT